jgi:hypothetical protein
VPGVLVVAGLLVVRVMMRLVRRSMRAMSRLSRGAVGARTVGTVRVMVMA